MGLVQTESKHADYWWMLISGAKDVCFNVNYENEFYVLLTVHIDITFVNNHLDAQFFLCMFISILYMFREAMCPSSGELILSI
jgi:hypothetical protein